MKNFKNFLSEGLAPASLKKAADLITVYIKNKLNIPLFNFTEVEEYKNSVDSGYGIRFFIPDGNRSFRINWKDAGLNMVAVDSVDVWLNSATPLHAKFDKNESLVKVLPLVVDLLNGDIGVGDQRLQPDGADKVTGPDTNESTVTEDSLEEASSSGGIEDVFDGVVEILQDPNFKKHTIWTTYKGAGIKIFDALVKKYPSKIVKSGVAYKWAGSKADISAIARDKAKILDSIGADHVAVTRGAGSETYKDDTSDEVLDKNVDRLPYKQQLKDLENLIKMTVSGSSNALFVAGRGGVGKTHTVEKVLRELGLKDNDGYFKNTGTASAAGLYALLFKNKNGIVLFDDSDDALKDQEARNIFKAATDTKKSRKLVWNKRGANVVDPDNDMSDEEILDQGLIPRYFEFTGKIIFISNLNMDKLDPDGAIRTRAYMIDINPTDEEVYDFMDEIVEEFPLQDGLSLNAAKRHKVVQILRTGTSKQTANLRKLSRGLNMYAAGGENLSDEELRRMISMYA